MEKSRRTLKSNIQNNINLKNNQEDKFNNVNKIEGDGKAKIKKKRFMELLIQMLAERKEILNPNSI